MDWLFIHLEDKEAGSLETSNPQDNVYPFASPCGFVREYTCESREIVLGKIPSIPCQI